MIHGDPDTTRHPPADPAIRRSGLPWWQATAAGAAATDASLVLGGQGGPDHPVTAGALALMHVVVGVAVVLALEAIRRRRLAPTPG